MLCPFAHPVACCCNRLHTTATRRNQQHATLLGQQSWELLLPLAPTIVAQPFPPSVASHIKMVILRILASFSHYTTPMESRSKFTQVLTDSYNINEEITGYPVSLLSSLFPNLFLTSIFLQKSFLGTF